MDKNIGDLEDALAKCIQVLSNASERTHRAEDRPWYQAHLAAAAQMFAALRGEQPIQALRTLVAAERHGYGWGYLSDEVGSQAEQAFDRFASLVETY